MSRFGVAVPDYNCWRAKKLLKNVVEGKHDEGYKVLPEYMRVFKEKKYKLCMFYKLKRLGP